MKPPTFFLSSTIYDFKDLRSAIKYYLEQQGCRVLASDFNDFAKPLDIHSYEACLKSIAQADYFLLFIGARVGGWYDENKKISITQKEYREAYRLHEEGKLKLLNFVRADVWRTKDDRKSLVKYLEECDLDPGAKWLIQKAPSKAATNAEFIIKFIEEVAKNRETATAVKGQGPKPTGNWLHVFENFQDIIEPIQMQVFLGKPVEEAAMVRLLRQELREILQKCLINPENSKKAFSPAVHIHNFYATLPRPLKLNDGETSTVNTEYYRQLLSLCTYMLPLKFFPQILPETVRSSAFMDYDPKTGEMTEQPVHAALKKLLIELQVFQIIKDDSEFLDKILRLLLEEMPKIEEPKFFTIDSRKLQLLLHTIDRWSNIIDLCKAIINHLDGQPFVMPRLRPLAAEDELEQEYATQEQLDKFLAEPFPDFPDISSSQDLN